MNRAERRRNESLSSKNENDFKKNERVINNLTPQQIKLIDLISDEKAIKKSNGYIDKFRNVVEKSMAEALLNFGLSAKETELVQDNMSEILEEHINKADGECIDMVVENRVSKDKVYDEFEGNSNRLDGKQMIQSAMKKFGFTKNTAETYYYAWKKAFMGQRKETGAIAMAETLGNKKPKIESKASQVAYSPEIKQEEEVTVNNLKIVEEIRIKQIKVEGNNGTYKAETLKGVTLSREGMSISFLNEEQLKEWAEEVTAVFKELARR